MNYELKDIDLDWFRSQKCGPSDTPRKEVGNFTRQGKAIGQ